MTWRPDLTVAAVVQREGRFLVVEESIKGRTLFNQPAGHVEDRESIPDAAVRETLEETAWHFIPRHLLGVYLWRNDATGLTTLRVAIIGDVAGHETGRALDAGIVAAHWMGREELAARAARLRSPLVMRCIDDFLGGVRHDLSALASLSATAIARTA